jgi:hypothetical protein
MLEFEYYFEKLSEDFFYQSVLLINTHLLLLTFEFAIHLRE